MPVTRLAPTIERVEAWAPVVVFAGLPTVGMVAGPSYSSMVIGLAVVWLLAGWGAGRDAFDRPVVCCFGWCVPAAVLGECGVVDCAARQRAQCVGADRRSCGAAGGLRRRDDRPGVTEAVFRLLLIATVVGVAVACLDMALGYPLQMSISTKPGVSAATK